MNFVYLPGFLFKPTLWDLVLSLNPNTHPLCPGHTQDSPLHKLSLPPNPSLIPDNTVLISWSLGGLYAIQLAHQYPEKIKKLILIASTPCFTEKKDWAGINLAEQEKFRALLNLSPERISQRFLSLVSYPEPLQESLRPYLDLSLNLSSHLASDQTALDFLFKSDLREIYKKLDLPIFYLFGEQDAIIQSSHTHQLLKLNQRASIHVIPHASHLPFISHPQESFQWLREALQDTEQN